MGRLAGESLEFSEVLGVLTFRYSVSVPLDHPSSREAKRPSGARWASNVGPRVSCTLTLGIAELYNFEDLSHAVSRRLAQSKLCIEAIYEIPILQYECSE